jgi:hypothetical protein
MRYNGHTFSGRLTWKGAGHMAGGEWMMRWERDHMDQKRGDGQMSEDEEGAKGSEPHRTVRWRTDGKMTRQPGKGGPMLIKTEAAEKDGIA